LSAAASAPPRRRLDPERDNEAMLEAIGKAQRLNGKMLS
jgi:hypothetical protein